MTTTIQLDPRAAQQLRAIDPDLHAAARKTFDIQPTDRASITENPNGSITIKIVRM